MTSMCPVNAVTLFTAGVLLDIISAMSWYTAIKGYYLITSLLTVMLTFFGYMSYGVLLSHANLEENAVAILQYSLGCGFGAWVGFRFSDWLKRRRPRGAYISQRLKIAQKRVRICKTKIVKV